MTCWRGGFAQPNRSLLAIRKGVIWQNGKAKKKWCATNRISLKNCVWWPKTVSNALDGQKVSKCGHLQRCWFSFWLWQKVGILISPTKREVGETFLSVCGEKAAHFFLTDINLEPDRKMPYFCMCHNRRRKKTTTDTDCEIRRFNNRKKTFFLPISHLRCAGRYTKCKPQIHDRINEPFFLFISFDTLLKFM